MPLPMYTLPDRLTTEEANQLKIDTLDMAVDTTSHHEACPRCGKRMSFSVTKQSTGLLYHCFRHKCGVRGFVPTMAASIYNEQPERKKTFKPNTFKGELVAIPPDIHKWLLESYEITKEDCRKNGWMYDKAGHRLAMPINNLYGYRAGLACKKLQDSEYTGPKVVNYWEADDKVRLHFPKTNSELSTIIVVEDILSATKLTHIAPSAAILGTSITTVQAAFLAKNFRNLVVMLDPDAVDKAMKIRNKYGAMFESIHIIGLDKDPKDTPLRRLEEILEDRTEGDRMI